MNLIERSGCAIGGKKDLEPLHCFPKFPVFMGCLDQPASADLKVDMDWWISRSSGLIQLKKLLPLNVLYPESHGAGAIGALWDKHHRTFARFVSEAAPTAVLELGGAHGILARDYKQFASIPWTILEPNPSPVDGCDARFIKGFFDEKFVFDGEFDTVVHSHVFEHIYEPDRFMEHLAGFMGNGKNLIFALPNMQVMLERKYTNCINFEHTIFLTEPYIEFLLAKHGFKIVRKEYFMDDHSIFYAAKSGSAQPEAKLPDGLYEKNRRLYKDYVDYHLELIRDLNRRVAATAGPVYLFGAHVFAQYLIEFGLDTSRIVSLLDNDARKQGKRLYGTALTVQSPKVLRGVREPAVILKAGVYNPEIKEDILSNINPATTFFE